MTSKGHGLEKLVARGQPIQHPGQQKSIFRLLEHARSGNFNLPPKKIKNTFSNLRFDDSMHP
jgi:hypothetical protein